MPVVLWLIQIARPLENAAAALAILVLVSRVFSSLLLSILYLDDSHLLSPHGFLLLIFSGLWSARLVHRASVTTVATTGSV